MYNKLLKWSGIIGISVLSLMIVGMLFYSARKRLVYVQAKEPQEQSQATLMEQEPVRLIEIKPEEKEKQNRFMIPVADLITQDAIYIENDYVKRCITITIQGMDVSFYEKTVMSGNLTGIQSVQAGNQGDSVIILISLDGVYEYEAVLENQKLGLTFKKPSEVYDRIVVLDAGHGGMDHGITLNGIKEDEFVMEIAERVKKKLESENIRVYMTRGDEDAPEIAQRVEFVHLAEADLVLSLHLAEGTEYGISAYYNDLYFTPEYTNVEFADVLVQSTSEAVNNRGNGVLAVDVKERDLLQGVTVPAAELVLGCPGNEEEAELLKRDDYKEHLADGICQAIRLSFEEIEE